MPTSTYNPKFKHVPREKLEIGKTYVCGDDEHEAGTCWRKNGEVVPLTIVEKNSIFYPRETLKGETPDDNYCSCSDLDHLYLYEETPMHKLSGIKAGDLLKNNEGFYRRALSDVMYPEFGELATVVMSMMDADKAELGLKRCGSVFTLFELEEHCFSIVSEKPTREEVLAKLTQEERNIIEGK